jgi:hypothetical protein
VLNSKAGSEFEEERNETDAKTLKRETGRGKHGKYAVKYAS